MELDILIVKGILAAIWGMIGIGIASKIYFFIKVLKETNPGTLWDAIFILAIICTIPTVIYIISQV